MAHCDGCGSWYPDTKIGGICSFIPTLARTRVCSACGKDYGMGNTCQHCGHSGWEIDLDLRCGGTITADED